MRYECHISYVCRVCVCVYAFGSPLHTRYTLPWCQIKTMRNEISHNRFDFGDLKTVRRTAHTHAAGTHYFCCASCSIEMPVSPSANMPKAEKLI